MLAYLEQKTREQWLVFASIHVHKARVHGAGADIPPGPPAQAMPIGDCTLKM
jgi:hypothetical protein